MPIILNIELDSKAMKKVSKFVEHGPLHQYLARQLGLEIYQISFSLEQRDGPKPAKSRADRLGQIVEALEGAKSDVEELKSELESWRENIPENLQGGEKYSALEEAEDSLDNVMNEIDSAVDSANSVEFPGMF